MAKYIFTKEYVIANRSSVNRNTPPQLGGIVLPDIKFKRGDYIEGKLIPFKGAANTKGFDVVRTTTQGKMPNENIDGEQWLNIPINNLELVTENLTNDINKDILNQKSATSPANKTKFAKGVFVTMVAAGIILPLIFAPKSKKAGYAVLFGVFGVLVGGGISLGLSGKIKD